MENNVGLYRSHLEKEHTNTQCYHCSDHLRGTYGKAEFLA